MIRKYKFFYLKNYLTSIDSVQLQCLSASGFLRLLPTISQHQLKLHFKFHLFVNYLTVFPKSCVEDYEGEIELQISLIHTPMGKALPLFSFA